MGESFRSYLVTARAHQTPVGDFVREARADPYMPDVKTWEELKDHLRNCGAHPDVIAIGRRVWRNYETWRMHAIQAVANDPWLTCP